MKVFSEWLREIWLEHYAGVLAENDIDFSVLHRLSEANPNESYIVVLGIATLIANLQTPFSTTRCPETRTSRGFPAHTHR